MGEGDNASSVFEIVEERAPRREQIRRMVTALGLGAITGGASPANPGGQRLQIIESASGDVVSTWTEPAADDARLLLNQMHSDLETMSSDDFAARWISD